MGVEEASRDIYDHLVQSSVLFKKKLFFPTNTIRRKEDFAVFERSAFCIIFQTFHNHPQGTDSVDKEIIKALLDQYKLPFDQ